MLIVFVYYKYLYDKINFLSYNCVRTDNGPESELCIVKRRFNNKKKVIFGWEIEAIPSRISRGLCVVFSSILLLLK